VRLIATHKLPHLSPQEALDRVLLQPGTVRVAAPYLRLKQLEGLLNRSFRLLIDENEAIRSNRGNCGRLRELLYTHPERVRTLPFLHAKAAIGKGLAMLGSSNFTEGGFRRNFELGVLIDETSVLEELVFWFDELWDQAGSLADEETFLRRCHGLMPAEPLERHLWEVGSGRFVNGYLKELGRMVRHFGLGDEDPRLVLSLPRNLGHGSSSGLLPVSVGRRYVAYATTGYFRERSAVLVLTLPPDCVYLDGDEVEIGGARFRTQAGEEVDRVPYYAWVPYFEDFGSLSAEVRSCWYCEIAYELERAKRSPWKKHHRPEFLRAAVDGEFRKRLLKKLPLG